MVNKNNLNLSFYKLNFSDLKNKYKLMLSKLNFNLNYNSVYFLSLKSKNIYLNLNKVTNNSIIIFSNCKDLNVIEESNFLKNKNIVYYFYNSSNITFLKNILSKNLISKNNVIVDKSSINFTNLFLDSNDLTYFQENFLVNKSNFSENDILLLSKQQKNNISIINTHLSKEIVSNTSIKNVLKDFSFVRYDGLINILKKADFSKAYLETNTMLLSKNAKSINIPMLEIVPKNVVATHAATVEQVTLDELFYLGSRGLSEKHANKLILTSFLTANISSYSEFIKSYILAKIKSKL
jgi:Fe-S cluster assembly scaffold protein SufB